MQKGDPFFEVTGLKPVGIGVFRQSIEAASSIIDISAMKPIDTTKRLVFHSPVSGKMCIASSLDDNPHSYKWIMVLISPEQIPDESIITANDVVLHAFCMSVIVSAGRKILWNIASIIFKLLLAIAGIIWLFTSSLSWLISIVVLVVGLLILFWTITNSMFAILYWKTIGNVPIDSLNTYFVVRGPFRHDPEDV